MSKNASRWRAENDLARMQPRPGRHAPTHAASVALRNVITGEVRVLAAGSAELAALRRERDALNGYRPLWVQTRLPKR